MDFHLDTAFFYLWLPCAVILFQTEYLAIMWLVSKTKFYLEEAEVRLYVNWLHEASRLSSFTCTPQGE